VIAVCAHIRRHEIEGHPLIRELSGLWSVPKVEFYFEKLAEHHVPGQVYMECLRIRLTKWICEQQDLTFERCCLVIERKKWFVYLKEYAASHRLHLLGVRCLHLPKSLRKSARFFYQLVNQLVKSVIVGISRSFQPGVPRRSDPFKSFSNENFKIALGYTGAKITFDPIERSDFFWVLDTDISFENLLLYNYSANNSFDKETMEEVRRRKMTVFGHAPHIQTWRPTVQFYRIFLKTLLCILKGIFRCTIRGQWVSPHFLLNLAALASDYAYWYDFYAAQRVRVNVSTINATTVGQVLALDSLNGISFAYQHTTSITLPTTFISAGENVQFVFSKHFKTLWDSIRAPVDRYIEIGFIYDGTAKAVRHSNRIRTVTTQLRQSGARFIICFFDENSIDRWDKAVSHENAAEDYAFLLQWLMDDPTLGLVFKPKRSSTLFERISKISDLIESARSTRRCVFLTSDTVIGSIYPAEAALMSDLCIGKLRGATAALEAWRAGVPTLLIDTESIKWHPFYLWGYQNVVFDRWESLRDAVETFRAASDRCCKPLGDWSQGWQDLDPFGDGSASQRMGSFIQWTYEAIKQGQSQQTAISYAQRRFEQIWGSGHITKGAYNG